MPHRLMISTSKAVPSSIDKSVARCVVSGDVSLALDVHSGASVLQSLSVVNKCVVCIISSLASVGTGSILVASLESRPIMRF